MVKITTDEGKPIEGITRLDYRVSALKSAQVTLTMATPLLHMTGYRLEDTEVMLDEVLEDKWRGTPAALREKLLEKLMDMHEEEQDPENGKVAHG
jgi:hypothetical protein